LYCTLWPSAAAQAAQTVGPVPPPVLRSGESPDELFAHRTDIVSAKRAAEIWASRAAGGRDGDASWKLARVCYFLGTQGPDAERRAQLDRGVQAGKQAVQIAPKQPEGHFWLAANMGTLAESFGLMQGLKYRGAIRDELQQVIAIAPGWQEGSAEAALGQWYANVPGLFGGSRDRAVEWLRKALTYNPKSSQALYALAEIFADNNKTRAEAKAMLQQVVDLPVDPEWAAEDRAVKAKAATLLAKLK